MLRSIASKTMLKVKVLYSQVRSGSQVFISDISLQSYRGKQDAYAEEEGRGRGRGRGRRRKRKGKGCVMADRYEMDYPLMQRNQYLSTYAAIDIYYKQYNKLSVRLDPIPSVNGSHTETRSPTQWRLMETEEGRRTGKVKEGEAEGTKKETRACI